MRFFYISLLILFLNAIQASKNADLRKNDRLDRKSKANEPDTPRRGLMRYFQHKKNEDAKDKRSAQNKASVLKDVRTHEEHLNIGNDMPSSKLTESIDNRIGREYFHLDPVFNSLKRRADKNYRRKGSHTEDSDGSSSSSDELKFWMDEWDEHWMQKKFEALNSTHPRGDVVNMVAARPWGVPCGDPNQHDMPWGTCMLPAECDAEYRIYRGDSFCGRTMYVCCALLLTNYDMYQGLDISFEGSSFSTDSNEKNDKKSKEYEKKKDKNERNKRKKARDKRKRKIKKSIKRIVAEIRTILNRAYRNGTAQRKKKTKELKKFIEQMKKQYKKDRKSVVNVHEYEMVKIDETLQARLDQIKSVNENFMSNDTFRDIVVNGTVNKAKLLRLLRTHPELAKLFKTRRMDSVQLDHEFEEKSDNPKGLEYDLEYGMLYY